MSKYVVKPDDPKNFVTVDIYIKNDPKGSFQVLTPDEEATLDFNNLPKDITKESSTWLYKKSFGVSNMIDEETLEEVPGKRLGEPSVTKRNFQKLQLTRIKYLLKDWTLKNDSPELVLKFVQIPGTNIKVIDAEQLKFIEANVDERILHAFIFKVIDYLVGLKEVDVKN